MRPKIKHIAPHRTNIFVFLLCFVIRLLLESPLYPQSQKSFQWIRQFGGNSWDISTGLICDSKNNLFITGSYLNSLVSGSNELISFGNKDIFIAKYSVTGELNSLNSEGGKGYDNASGLCLKPDDNIAIAGIISDSVTFGKITLAHTGSRLFIANLNPMGVFTWISTIDITAQASITDILSDNTGRIFVAGIFTDTLKTENETIASCGKKDIFIARIGNSGKIEKLIKLGGVEEDISDALSIAPSGDIVIGGSFKKTFNLDSLIFYTSNNGIRSNIFIICFDNDLNPKWHKTCYGTDYLQVSSLKHDAEGNLYLSGTFNDNIDIADTVFSSNGHTDIFLIKLDTSAKKVLGRSFGSWYYDYMNSLNIDNLGGVYLTGSIGDSLSIDDIHLKPGSSRNSAMLFHFNKDGYANWGDFISGSGRNFGSGSAVDNKGNLYVTGGFNNSVEKGLSSLLSIGDQDIFIAKYYNCPDEKAEIQGNLSFCSGTSTDLSVRRGYTNVVWNDTVMNKNSITVTNAGRYWVNMVDQMGCTVTDTVLVTENSLPGFSLGRDTSINVTDSLILYAPEDYSILQWQDLSIEPWYEVKSQDNSPGESDYWLSVTDSINCSFTDTITITFLKVYDWIDLQKVQLIAYPNPASDIVNWSLKTEEPCKLIVELTDINSKVLYHSQIDHYTPGEVREIYIGDLVSGTYNLHIGDTSIGKYYKALRIIKK